MPGPFDRKTAPGVPVPTAEQMLSKVLERLDENSRQMSVAIRATTGLKTTVENLQHDVNEMTGRLTALENKAETLDTQNERSSQNDIRIDADVRQLAVAVTKLQTEYAQMGRSVEKISADTTEQTDMLKTQGETIDKVAIEETKKPKVPLTLAAVLNLIISTLYLISEFIRHMPK